MPFRYAALFLCFTLPSLARAENLPRRERNCRNHHRDLIPARVEASDTIYKVIDRDFPDFHITGSLAPDGTLSISSYRELSNGDRARLEPAAAVRAMLEHFGPKVTQVELKLSQFHNIDDINISKEEELDRFNQAWVNASRDPKLVAEERMVGDLANRDGKIVTQAALATDSGFAVARLRFDLSRIQLKSSLGRNGKFVAVDITFSRP